MGKKIFGVDFNRVAVLALLILIPSLVFYLFFDIGSSASWLPDSLFRTIFVGWITPICFSVCWLYIILVYKKDIADVLDLMDQTGSVIPTRMKFFFSMNAVLMLALFIIPFLSPIVTILTFASLIWKASTSNRDLEYGESIGVFSKIIIIILSIIPILAGVFVFPGLLTMAATFWNEYWVANLDTINKFNMALATSFTIGDTYMLFAILKGGPSEYQYLETEKELSSPYTFGKRVVQLLALALMIYLAYIEHEFFTYMTWIGLILVCVIWLLTTAISSKERNFNISNNILGYILVVIFFAANLVAFPGENANTVVRNISLLVSGSVYLFVFFYALFHIDEIRDD
jgi:hypothetical protein